MTAWWYMRYFLPKLLLPLCLSVLVCPVFSWAAHSGSSGATSTGDLDITLTIATLQKITGIANINFGTYSGTGDISRDDDVCVYNNRSDHTYNVKLSGSGANNVFVVARSGKTIPYRVFWNVTTGTTGNVEATKDVTLTSRTGASSLLDCGAANTANFQVTIARSDIMKVPPGIYTGTLSIAILPPS